MIYLVLAIVSSALISVIMRLGEGKIRNNMGMFVINYLICIVLARLYVGRVRLVTDQEGLGTAIGLGTLAGVLYLVNFVLLQQNIRKNGVVLATTFMKLGVVIPTLMAIFVFHEQPKVTQVIGIGLTVAAIIMIHFEKEDMAAAAYKGLLVLMLLCSGITDSLANIYEQVGNSALGNQYLFCTFLAALLCAAVLCVRGHERIGIWDVAFGILLGIPNYYSARFLLLSLSHIPAVIVYPVYSVAAIVAVSLVSLICFHEKLSRKKCAAMGVILAALILLNI